MASCLRHAIDKEREADAWDVWIAKYPWMDEENYEEFEDFKKRVLAPNIQYSDKSNEEILEEMEAVVKAYENKKRGES